MSQEIASDVAGHASTARRYIFAHVVLVATSTVLSTMKARTRRLVIGATQVDDAQENSIDLC